MATSDHSKTFYLRTVVDAKKTAAAVSKLEPTKEKPYTVKISIDDESRNNKQNRLSFLLYRVLGDSTGHGEGYERRNCKLTYGVPILWEDEEFHKFYSAALAPLTHEQKLEAMEFVPVTSLMSIKQFARYLDTVYMCSADRGIILPKPEDLYWEALMKAAGQMA